MRLAAFLPVVLCLGLAACGQSQNSGGQSSDASSSGSSGGGDTMAKMEPVVSVDGGQIRGQIKDGVASYLAIPYAASPIGNLRWMPPQPVAALGRCARRHPIWSVLHAGPVRSGARRHGRRQRA